MKKLLRPKDIFLLTLAGIGDMMEEIRDPLHVMSFAYKNMYGFVPRRYKKHNFLQMVGRSLKTGDIEKVVKNGKVYLRLTSVGKSKIVRDFTIFSLVKKWNNKWIVLVFDISEKTKLVRDKLRNKLESIGFGMLQESVWITALPIGKDLWEFIESIGLADNVFVMEVSSLLAGDPKLLARKVWNLDKYEGKYLEIKKEIERANQLIEKYRGHENKREAKLPSGYFYRLEQRKRELNKGYLELMISLPRLPIQLLPKTLQSACYKYFAKL